MTMFGIQEAVVAQAVRAVTPHAVDRDEVEERFARAAWSTLAEPGDRIAGAAVGAAGAASALSLVIGDVAPERLAGALSVAPQIAADALARWKPRLASAQVVAALHQAARCGARLMIPGDALWPNGVDDLELHAPLALWARGPDDALAALDRAFALVGARAATGYGEHVTMEASAGLVDRGFAIVSGAAYGIDGMAHRAALAGGGITAAVLAGGVDRFYPSGHEELLTRIAREGVVLSELPCGSAPTRWRFLQRNRIISALGRATVVLEAGRRSGSINTAGHAASLGRPLGAVPGPVTSSASAGCHRIIRELGAVCVTDADEMAQLVTLDPADGDAQSRDDADTVRVLDALGTRAARGVADLAARSGLAAGAVRSVLGALDLEGRARETDAGWLRARP